MEQNDSIDKLIDTLMQFENKEQTIDEALDNIYQKNINNAFNNTDQCIRTEIEKTKNFLNEMKLNLNKMKKIVE